MIDRRIKFRHIQCFVEICREKSLKDAAEKLFLTRPAISKTLKELEEIIGVDLMTRNRAGVSLTNHGEVFLHFAEMSLASLQQGLNGIGETGAAGKTRLVIGALPSVMARLIPAVTVDLSQLAPYVELKILDGSHEYLMDRLRLGEIDIVIGRLGRPDVMRDISFIQLYEETVEFVVRAGHPLIDAPDLRRIGEWQVIYPPQGSAIRPLVERFLIANGVGDFPNRLETVSGAFGRIYTRQSDAVWIISAGVVSKEVADGLLVPLPFDTSVTKGAVGLMQRAGVVPAPAEQMFFHAVRNSVSQIGLNG